MEEEKTMWLVVAVSLYWVYCLVEIYRTTKKHPVKTAEDFFIAGRSLGKWTFIFAVTATSYSAWTFISHPGLIYLNGFQCALLSLYAITIPLSGVLFLKRQWILGKHYGFVTPGEMFSEYFKSPNTHQFLDGIRISVVVIACLFSIFYLAIQLRASGLLFKIITGKEHEILSMWLLAIVLFTYVAWGLRAMAKVDSMQFFLLIAGILGIGVLILNEIGGWNKLNEGIATLTQFDYNRAPNTESYSHYIAIPGMIEWVGDKQTIEGNNYWTGTMILTFLIAILGIQTSPDFTMWAFSSRSPKPFIWQQVLVSSIIMGLLMLIFTTILGIGANLITGTNEAFSRVHPLTEHSLGQAVKLGDELVPRLISFLADIQQTPWLAGLLAICALAAMQSTAAPYVSTLSGMLVRDIYKPFFNPQVGNHQQIRYGRWWMTGGIILAALVMSTLFEDIVALAFLGGLAVAFGSQMMPALLGVCYRPFLFLTRKGIFWGLWVGILVVIFTDKPGYALIKALFGVSGLYWPLTIHSAVWGLLFNFVVAIWLSCHDQNREEREHRQKFHDTLGKYTTLSKQKQKWVPVAWIITLLWFIFAVGPGAIIGNDWIGDPNDPSSWPSPFGFTMPPIWLWQMLGWVWGVFMIWFLAYVMEMSTLSDEKIEEIEETTVFLPSSSLKPQLHD